MKNLKDSSNQTSTSKQPNRFLSSDETRPIEGGRASKRSDVGVDVGPGSEQTSMNSTEGSATRIGDGISDASTTRLTSNSDKELNQDDEETEMSNEHDSIHLPSMFAAGLPRESVENLERVLTKGREVLLETKNYVKENPAEAAGLLACSGAILWALVGTKPGRRLVEYGSPLVSRYLANGFNQTFALQGRNLQ